MERVASRVSAIGGKADVNLLAHPPLFQCRFGPELQRPVGESQAVAFSRFIEKCDDGQILYRAYRLAPGPDWQPPTKITKAAVPYQGAAMSKLEKLAEETRANSPQLMGRIRLYFGVTLGQTQLQISASAMM